ncbi:CoA transferase subunit A [Diaphorobacter caeni]|uniref:CoA transferase subunit A n=1 Tax=Diaphorobacter caeni TaxID=2784387 RepID=UPI00188E608F|nr:CoA transferase subunit A [Diaphorobacter caeni]MBF5007471.1 CoA transferase subunit A [Diaphorobacter caeni]
MVNKVMSAKDVVASIQDGMTIGIGGWGPRRKPMALVRELLRSDVKDLTVVSYGGADVGMLCAAGKVKKLIFAFVTLDFIPLEPYFRKARQSGEIEVVEVDEGQMLLGLKAAAMRVPYIPTRIGLGTDLVKHNPQIKVIGSPYDSKEWVAMPALHLDVALLHVDKADARGVCQISGPDMYMDDLYARAAKKTFVSCDELVDSSAFESAESSRLVFWERSETTGVVHLPCGAHPTSCGPAYGFDNRHFKEYASSAKEDSGWSDYVNKYVNCTEQEYLDKVGGADAIKRLPLPVF